MTSCVRCPLAHACWGKPAEQIKYPYTYQHKQGPAYAEPVTRNNRLAASGQSGDFSHPYHHRPSFMQRPALSSWAWTNAVDTAVLQCAKSACVYVLQIVSWWADAIDKPGNRLKTIHHRATEVSQRKSIEKMRLKTCMLVHAL